MRKKVRRSLALLLALTMMVTLVKSEELFVSAESGTSAEQVCFDTEETIQEETEFSLPEAEVLSGGEQEEETVGTGEGAIETPAEETASGENTSEQEEETPKAEAAADGTEASEGVLTEETSTEEALTEEGNVSVEETEVPGTTEDLETSDVSEKDPAAPSEETEEETAGSSEENSAVVSPGEEEVLNAGQTSGTDAVVSEIFEEESIEKINALMAGAEEDMIALLSLDGATVTIRDDIMTSGSLTAVIDGNVGEESLEYQWYVLEGGAWSAIEDTDTVDSKEASYYVARDGAQKTYRVEVTDGNGTTITSNSFKVNYYDALQNGSFETPVVSEGDYLNYGASHFLQIPNGTAGLEWKTTAYGSRWNSNSEGYYIEIADGSSKRYGGQTNSSSTVYNISGAADGDQFAELNCEVAGALYQDILTQPGSTLYWGLEHAGRGGQDTMAVIISDTNSLPADWDPSGTNYNDRPDDVQAVITDDKGTWNYHTGVYTVPEGQYVTRFYFVAVGASAGAADGNLLDNISFSKDVPNPPSTKGTLVINKTVSEIKETLIPAGSFKFEVKDSAGNVVDTVSLPTEKGDWSYVSAMTPGTYTVTEEANDIQDYKLTGTEISVNGQDAQSGMVSNISVVKKETTTVAYTNTYEPETAELTVKKVFKGLTEEEVRGVIDGPGKDGEALSFDVAYYLEGTSGATGNYSFSAKDYLGDGDGKTAALTGSGTEWTYSYTISKALLNKYYNISETHYGVAGYQCKTEAEVSGATVISAQDKAQADQFKLEGNTTVVFTNTYTRNKDLTISKKIVGIDPSEISGLTFTVTGTDGNKAAEFKLSDMTSDGTGSYTYTLTAVEPGTYSVSESGYDVTDYDCTTEYQIDAGKKETGNSATVVVGTTASAELSFTNTYESLLRTVTVKKVVEGNMGDRKGTFEFTAKVEAGVELDFTPSGSSFDGRNHDGIHGRYDCVCTRDDSRCNNHKGDYKRSECLRSEDRFYVFNCSRNCC